MPISEYGSLGDDSSALGEREGGTGFWEWRELLQVELICQLVWFELGVSLKSKGYENKEIERQGTHVLDQSELSQLLVT